MNRTDRLIRLGVKPGQWGWRWQELEAAWSAADEAGFDVVSCFDHVSAAPSGAAAWDAPTLLCAMAGATERARLSVDVLNVSLRPPFLLAAQLAVVQAAAGGRLEIGLGAGSYHLARFDHEALRVPFPPYEERLARLEVCVRDFPALWRGEEVEGASLGPLGIEPPPIHVAGRSERALALAERAGGWVDSTNDPEEFAQYARRLPDALPKRAQVFVRDVTPSAQIVERFAEAGATTLTFVLTDGGRDDVVRLAETVL